jgi:hypothetical protein
MKTVEEIVAIKRKHQQSLLLRPGVTGVDVGFKYIGGKRTEIVAIRVMVRVKGEFVEAGRVPQEIDGIPTDVIQREFFAR